MSVEMQRIIQAKEVERRRLRDLPWLEKLEILDRLRSRQLWQQSTQPRKDYNAFLAAVPEAGPVKTDRVE